MDVLNLIANLLTVGGMLAVGFVLYQLLQLNKRLELVLAPKLGIEGYLNMCSQAVDNDPDGTCVVDDEGVIEMVNKEFESISGFHRSELIGKEIEIVVPDASRGLHKRQRDGFVDTPASRPMRGLELKHKRGRIVPVDIRLNWYSDATGGHTIAKVRVPHH